MTDPATTDRPGAVDLSHVQRPLRLLAEGLAGRPVRWEVLPDGSAGWPFEIDLPEPGEVRLSPSADEFDAAPDNRTLYRSQVVRQISFELFGSFTADAVDGTATEAMRSPRDHPLVLASPQRSLAADLVVVLEDVRVGAAVRRSFPGAVGDLDAALALARARVRSETVDDLLGIVRRLAIGEATSAGPGRTASLVGHATAACAAVRADTATVDDSARLAVALAALAASPTTDERFDTEGLAPAPLEPEDLDVEPRDLEGLSTSPPPLDAEADREGVDLDGPVQATPIASTPDLEPAPPPPPTRPNPSTSRLAPIADDALVHLYDEWDCHTQQYLRSWCRIVERRMAGGSPDFIADVRRRHVELGRRIRRQFALLRPEERIRTHRNIDGDELDLDALIEAIVDRRSGASADDRLHIRRERARRDVATAFLVDLSASTSSPAEPAEPVDPTLDDDDSDPWSFEPRPPTEPARRVLDVAKDAVALMCDALDQLGDEHAVYGFSGQGRHHVAFQVAKDFGDRTSSTTWSGLAAMEPIGYTRMGPAIRHAAAKLALRDARTKLLILISDGHPQDSDYGPNRSDKQYGLLDTARSLAEATEAGIDTFCVTIDPAGKDYLRTMCPDDRYLVIDEVTALPSELAKLYLTLARPRFLDGREAMRRR